MKSNIIQREKIFPIIILMFFGSAWKHRVEQFKMNKTFESNFVLHYCHEEMKERQKRNQANGHWRILNLEK